MNYAIVFFYLWFANPTQVETHTLTLKVTNIVKVQGTLEIGIFNQKEGFLEEGRAMKTLKIKINGASETIVIPDLPKGTYAVSMYQDRNSDGECNKNFMGIPKEPYAFSNNFRPKLSAPTFDDCKFQLASDQSLNITLK